VPGQAKPVEIDIDAAGSATGFEGLANRQCDLALASRMVTDAEAERVRAAGLGDLRALESENVIGLDGVAVLVNSQNPARSLTTEEIGRFFDGSVATWSAASGGGPVHVYARDDRSGTFDTFRALVLGERPLSPSAKRFADSDELARQVAADPAAIGFAGMSRAGRTSMVAISEGGGAAIAPTRFSVATEDYPLARRLYVYAPSPALHPLAGELVAFALSPEGQTLVSAAGFVDLAATAMDGGACDACPAAYASLTHGAKRLSLGFRFRTASTDLDTRAVRDVSRLAALLRAQRNPRVALIGFSDGQGTHDANLQVSRARAKAVADRLEPYGIHADVVEGFGDAMPVASNDSPAGRERNRRVEAWVLVSGAPQAPADRASR
jgi:phosphate transport system substrate-binding protein